MSETRPDQLIGIAVQTLRELRASGDADADALREAGYAGGGSVFTAFERWIAEQSRSAGGDPASDAGSPARDLPVSGFASSAGSFFHDAGWGRTVFSAREEDGTAVIDIDGCWEADPAAGAETPSCHVTTGMLAGFFGRLAGYPVAVMETECRSAGAQRCRFLMGNTDVMARKWEELS